MSNQNSPKRVLPEDNNYDNKFKDIEEAIQKAIKSESSKSHHVTEKQKASPAK